jgi:hypothetical protein
MSAAATTTTTTAQPINALLLQKRDSNSEHFRLSLNEINSLLPHFADAAAPQFALRRALARAVSVFAIPPISDFKVCCAI